MNHIQTALCRILRCKTYSTIILVLTALAFCSTADARHPTLNEMSSVKEIAIQLEIDTNEAYYVAKDAFQDDYMED